MKVKNGRYHGVDIAIENTDEIRIFIGREDTEENRKLGAHKGWLSDGKIAIRRDVISSIKWGDYMRHEPERYREGIEFEATGKITEKHPDRPLATLIHGTGWLEHGELAELEITQLIYRIVTTDIRICILRDSYENPLWVRTVDDKYSPVLKIGNRCMMERDSKGGKIFVYDEDYEGPIALVMPLVISDVELHDIEDVARSIIYAGTPREA